MLVKISVKGLKETQRRLGQDLRRPITKRLQQAGTQLLRAARQEVPVRTGKLKASLAVIARGQMSFELVEGAPQGLWIREGTIAHSIFPKRPKYALMWPGLPHPVGFAAHPGIRHKNDYPGRAVQAANLENILRDLQAELVTELGG